MSTATDPQPPRIDMRRGPYFGYALPDGWLVTEESNHVLSLVAPDRTAAILVYGISGLVTWVSPQQFVQMQLPGLLRQLGAQLLAFQVLGARPIQPLLGYTAAEAIDLAYTWANQAETRQVRAVALCSVATVYARCDAVMTLASSKAELWPYYGAWLPGVAAQAVNVGGNAYSGVATSGVIADGVARVGQTFQETQYWSQVNSAGVQAARDAAFAHQQAGMDAPLTGQQWYANPYGYPAQRLAAGQSHWMHRDGRIASFDNAADDPNTSIDPNWTRMQPGQG